MDGQTPIKELQEAVIVFKDKGNEIIKRLNLDWFIDLPDPQFGEATVKGSDTEVRIDLSQVKVIQLVGCKPDGSQVTVNVIGYISEQGVP